MISINFNHEFIFGEYRLLNGLHNRHFDTMMEKEINKQNMPKNYQKSVKYRNNYDVDNKIYIYIFIFTSVTRKRIVVG